MAEQSVELLPGESKVVSFEAIPKVAKTYQVTVDGLSGSFIAVEPLKYGDLRGRVYHMVTTESLAGAAVSIAGQTAYTDSAGEYGFPSMQVGTYPASFSKEGYVTTYYEALVIKEGDNVKNVGLVPEPTPTGRLSGKVTDSFYGTPVSGVKVPLSGYRAVGDPPRTEQVYYETFTDDQGQYSFSNVLTMSYDVSFIKESYESKVVPINLQFEDKVLNVKLLWTAAGLRLYFSNPQIGASVWDASLINLSTMQKIPGTPAGPKEPSTPMDFVIPSLTFLLQVMEWPWAPDPGPYWLGPYLVELPGPGTYTWNSREGAIDGIECINMPLADNESDVVATITAFDWIEEGKWSVSLNIESTKAVGSKYDWAAFYSSILCRNAVLPLDSVGQPMLEVGTEVTCKVKMEWGGYAYQWKAWDFQRKYPYSFSGSINSIRDYKKKPLDLDYWHDISYSVSGTKPTFAGVIVQFNVYGRSVNQWTLYGPTSGVLKGVSSWYAPYLRLYANPDPFPGVARWNDDTWIAKGWIFVNGLYLHWSDE